MDPITEESAQALGFLSTGVPGHYYLPGSQPTVLIMFYLNGSAEVSALDEDGDTVLFSNSITTLTKLKLLLAAISTE